jgi:hypothetical protein
MNAAARLIGICLVLVAGTVAGVVAVSAPAERPAPARVQKCVGPIEPGSSC